MNEEDKTISELQRQISTIEARLNAVDADTLKAIGSNSVIEALVKRAGDALLDWPHFKTLRNYLIGFAGLGLVVWAGGTVYSSYQIISVQERAAQAEQKMEAAETAITTQSDKVVKESLALESTIDARIQEITKKLKDRIDNAVVAVDNKIKPAKQRIEKAAQAVEQASVLAEERISGAASAVENAVDPAEARIEAAAQQVETKSEVAIKDIASQQDIALTKLHVPSIDQLGKVKAQIEGLERAGARLNLKSIRSFIDLQVFAVLIFSVVAFAISIAAWIRASRKRGI
jgi:enamine deaminase RidA (YjgF/YER057c/UK114 family)